MDAESLAKTKSQMHSFAMGEAMAQAARDYQNVRGQARRGRGGGEGAEGVGRRWEAHENGAFVSSLFGLCARKKALRKRYAHFRLLAVYLFICLFARLSFLPPSFV